MLSDMSQLRCVHCGSKPLRRREGLLHSMQSKMPSYIFIVATFLAIPLLVFGFLLFTEPSEHPLEETFVAKEAEVLLLASGDLPSYYPNWYKIYDGNATSDDAEGLSDTRAIAYRRRAPGNRSDDNLLTEQVVHRVYVFDSIDYAKSFYGKRLTELQNETVDVVYDITGFESTCRGYYTHYVDLDSIIAPCRYANVVFEVKATSREFASKELARHVINVTESKALSPA